MWSGLETLNKIDGALHSIRTDAVRLDTQLAQMTHRIAEAERQRMSIIHAIVKVRLEGIESGELSNELTTADRDAISIMASRETAFDQLNASIEAQHKLVGDHESRRNELLGDVNKVSQQIRDVEADVQSKLKKDAQYQALLDGAKWAQTIAIESRNKVEVAQSNMAEKAVPYKADPLFMYLWQRGFGTTEYAAGLIARWLDAKIARLIKYESARVNFWNLTQIPLRLEQHAVQLAEQADTELMAVQAYEISARNQAGIEMLEKASDAAREALDKADDLLEEQEIELNKLLAERAQYVGGDDLYTQQCLSRLATALDHRDLDAVYRYALSTSSITDDQLVLELNELEQRNESVKADLQDLRKLHERQIKKLEDIEGVRRQFKNSRFDDARSSFKNGDLLVATLSQFVQGMVSGAEVWQVLERNQKYVNAAHGPEFGSGSLGQVLGRGSATPRNHHSTNSTWSWPKPRTSSPGRTSARGSGKFKTGGSF